MKDILIPGLQLVATIVIGVFIAIYLNRKTNKDKIKNMLIDTYIEYFKKFHNYMEQDTFNLLGRILIQLRKQVVDDQNFDKNSQEVTRKRLTEIIEELSAKYSHVAFGENTSFTYYTHKFAFLLTKKRYKQKLQPLQDKYLVGFLSSSQKKEEQITEILNHSKTMSLINKLKVKFTDEDFDNLMKHLNGFTIVVTNRDQFATFDNYNEALIDEIDKF